MGAEVLSHPDVRTQVFTAEELGISTDATGAGNLVTLVDVLPEGWSVRNVDIRREGDITSGTGTVAVDVGVTDDEDAIVAAEDIEGSGVGWVGPTVTRYDSVAPIAVVARVTTATANPSAVAGISIEVELVKYGLES